jgi:hypothetical protein
MAGFAALAATVFTLFIGVCFFSGIILLIASTSLTAFSYDLNAVHCFGANKPIKSESASVKQKLRRLLKSACASFLPLICNK